MLLTCYIYSYLPIYLPVQWDLGFFRGSTFWLFSWLRKAFMIRQQSCWLCNYTIYVCDTKTQAMMLLTCQQDHLSIFPFVCVRERTVCVCVFVWVYIYTQCVRVCARGREYMCVSACERDKGREWAREGDYAHITKTIKNKKPVFKMIGQRERRGWS